MSTTVEGSKRWGPIKKTHRINIAGRPISTWFQRKGSLFPFRRIAVMVGQWGVPGWNFCLCCCVTAQSSLFARGGGGVCNYLLDYGYLQVYLWMIISFKQSINVQYHLFVSLLSLPCYTVLHWGIMLLYTISPRCQILAFRGYLEVSDWCLECVWECLLSRGRIWSGANP